MKVNELIAELQKVDGDSRVFMGYDGNVVVTEPFAVISVSVIIAPPRDCWYGVEYGDTVILCDR